MKGVGNGNLNGEEKFLFGRVSCYKSFCSYYNKQFWSRRGRMVGGGAKTWKAVSQKVSISIFGEAILAGT